MEFPQIQGKIGLEGNFFYFGCDRVYFDNYGKPLINSLKKNASWANIHCHIFNPSEDQLKWCDSKDISVSYEYIENSISEIKTYYACVRFIRVPEIFKDSARIISLDCDSIATAPLSEIKFLQDTNNTKVFWRTKGNKSLASLVIFGLDNLRHDYSIRLKEYFKNDTFKWFLDQEILDEMISKNQFGITTDVYWGSPGKKKNSLIWSGKGNKKFASEFQNLIDLYRD